MKIVINQEAIEHITDSLSSFVYSKETAQEVDDIREQFKSVYNKEHIENLTIEDYFLGHGRKQGNLAYDLEYRIKTGSIKGGSKFKFGYEADFQQIKSLFIKIVNLDIDNVYKVDGTPSKDLQEVVNLSKVINGFKTGKTVIPKFLSLYFHQTFLPIFNSQDKFLSILLIDGLETEKTGLDQYLEYNFKLLKVKEKIEHEIDRKLENNEYCSLLYHTFLNEPSEKETTQETTNESNVVEPQFEALEVQHYQTLLHKNFKRLFPNLRYFDEDSQKVKNGQYDTQTVGIMDFLTVDYDGNFVVIEIKRKATDDTIGQILRYMGWTQEELCKDGQKVTGLIVAEKKDVKLEFALKVMPSVKFIKLSLSISLNEE
jgi:hypothetical protein